MYVLLGNAGILGGLGQNLYERLLREIVPKLDHRTATLVQILCSMVAHFSAYDCIRSHFPSKLAKVAEDPPKNATAETRRLGSPHTRGAPPKARAHA